MLKIVQLNMKMITGQDDNNNDDEDVSGCNDDDDIKKAGEVRGANLRKTVTRQIRRGRSVCNQNTCIQNKQFSMVARRLSKIKREDENI